MTITTKERQILLRDREVRAVFADQRAQLFRGIKAGVECPFHPGERRWVREKWATHNEFDNVSPRDIPQGERITYANCDDTAFANKSLGRWRKPKHMPRWASRITLEITAVDVERSTNRKGWLWSIECKRLDPPVAESLTGRG